MTRKPFAWLVLPGVIAIAVVIVGSYELGASAARRQDTAESAGAQADLQSNRTASNLNGPTQSAGTPGAAPALTITSTTQAPAAALPTAALSVATSPQFTAPEATPAATQTASPSPTALASVAAAVVTTPTATPTASPSSTPAYSGAVLAGVGLNLRSGPALAYPVILTLPGGTTFTVLGQDSDGGWMFVALANGQTGWLDRSFTTYIATAPVVAAPPLPPTPAPTPTAPPAQVSQPTIQIIAPGSGSTYAMNQQVTVQSVATASGGVSQIQLLVDNALVQSTPGGAGQQTLQASQQWTATTQGSHVLTVVAIDMSGNRSQPASISVNVTLNAGPPQVSILQPNQTIVVQAGQVVTIQSQATSGIGINRIELWADGQFFTSTSTGNAGGQTLFNVSQTWSSGTLGQHTLFVRAYDSNGQSADSAGVIIGVVDTNPPQLTVSISANTVLVGQAVTVYSSASDSKGITVIELWADGAQVAVTNSTSPVGQDSMSAAQTWQTGQLGQHTLWVIARDSVGKLTQSSSMMVNVLPVSTPLPTPTPLPTNTPTPLPNNTPTPTLTPLPTNTPTPAPQPTNTPTPLPTNTPAPTPTPLPTNTPRPTRTPRPRNTPTPTLQPTNRPRPT